ncbi:T9SS type A sorting domain-containing protein [Aquimarina sp. TRL1]|uniref:T9SS type A sorting domain-containing protein n=1 Tax=Aquimarina sp. (strain TRL1) TaxID=2736252 RepID=UPI00158BA53C|nr:T9SS type A sorting domain-containing protein [Aquimarina sp. TRL1]QKX06788.1 T9SS type A sorting domain-containing protein [Aquimarina sp. TRL1]
MRNKYKLFTILLAFVVYHSTAQNLVRNGDFSNYNTNCSLSFSDAFTNNSSTSCVDDWTSYSGSPSLHGTPTNPYAWMWSRGRSFESIRTSVAFKQGVCYTVSFSVRTNDHGDTNTNAGSTINLRAVNIRSTGGIQNEEDIFTDNIGNYLNNYRTVQVTFTPTRDYETLLINPYYAGSGRQAEMSIDGIVIEERNITNTFGFEDVTTASTHQFYCQETVFLNGTASEGEDRYIIYISKRPLGSTGSFQWAGTTGWISGPIGRVNLTNVFQHQGVVIENGYEYEIKVALQNDCTNWEPLIKRFTMQEENKVDTAFSVQYHCDSDGTITVVANAADPNGTHWWGLYETTQSGSISDTDTVGLIGTVQSGTTVTFSGLSTYKNYYIKHGVWNSCYPWTEARKATDGNVSWSPRTSDFSITSRSFSNGTIHISALALSNSVFVNHWWAIYDSATNAQITPIECCGTIKPSFSFAGQLNKKYYIKHGIWNDCMGWKESRTEFWFGQEPSGQHPSEYYSEIHPLDFSPSTAYLAQMNAAIISGAIIEDNIMMRRDQERRASLISVYPNPAYAYETIHIDSSEDVQIKKVYLLDMSGAHIPLEVIQNRTQTKLHIKTALKKGVYFIKVIDTANKETVRQLLIQ